MPDKQCGQYFSSTKVPVIKLLPLNSIPPPPSVLCSDVGIEEANRISLLPTLPFHALPIGLLERQRWRRRKRQQAPSCLTLCSCLCHAGKSSLPGQQPFVFVSSLFVSHTLKIGVTVPSQKHMVLASVPSQRSGSQAPPPRIHILIPPPTFLHSPVTIYI